MTHERNAEYLRAYRQRRKERAEREISGVWLDESTRRALDKLITEGSTAKKVETVIQVAMRDCYIVMALRGQLL